MKKIFSKEIFLIPILILTLFVQVNKVNADTGYSYAMSHFYSKFDVVISDFQDNTSPYADIYNKYITDYSDTYPFYMITINYIEESYSLKMWETNPNLSVYLSYCDNSEPRNCDIISNSLTYHSLAYVQNSWQFLETTNRIYLYSSTNAYSNLLVSSNFNITLVDSDSNYSSLNPYTLQIPPLTNSIHDIDFQYFELVSGDIYPSYSSLYNGDYAPSISYTSINLNNYPYVALSLKNYGGSAFSTTFIVEGQLCITPVYNYGMTEKTGAGYQVDRCSAIYNIASPMRVDILDSDIQNNAIFYLKAYDLSINNVIKVDNSIFNITYITSETESQPYVRVNGRSYPTIPYNDLTSSSTQSEAEGYVSGRVVNTWDTSMSEETINNLFTNPLQALSSVWTTIIAMFTLIGSFIVLLPETLQTFLFVAFTIGITLGILKILL